MDIYRQWIETEGLKILVLKDTEPEQAALVSEANAVIIVSSDDGLTGYLLGRIRTDEAKEIYLKPVFLYVRNRSVPAAVKTLIDGEFFNLNSALPGIAKTATAINEKVSKLDAVQGMNFDSYVLNKMLRFLYSREMKDVQPVLSRSSKLGYYYPFLSVHYNASDERNILDVLKVAEDEGLLTGAHVDTVYLCNHCFNGFLFYREVCPKCEGTSLSQEDLVHHFPCAYIGPMSDFTDKFDKSELTCPKCNKYLRHIGVDYDKPSMIYNCNSCNHTFQDVQIKAKCCECEKDSAVEHLLMRTVKKYQVTNKGLYTALHGITSTRKDLSEIPGTVNMDTFQIMLQYEIERMKIAKIESNLGYIHINNAADLYLQVGRDSKLMLLAELVQLIRNSIRASDVIAFENSSTLLFSLTESKQEEALKTVRKISILIRKLIRDNFKGFQAEVDYKIHPVKNDMSHLEQLKELTGQMANV